MKHYDAGFSTTNSTIHLEQYLEDNLSKSKVLLQIDADKRHQTAGGPGGPGRFERIPALVTLGIDREALSDKGLNKPEQDALYRSLFVYSHGAHNIITEYSRYSDPKLPGKLWNALLYLVDSCDPGNTELISSEIKEMYTEKFNSLMDFHQKFVELGEIQIGKLTTSEAISKLKYLEIVNSTHLDNIALESIQVRQRQQIETTKTMLESALKHRDEMKDLYMEAQMKLFERDKEIAATRKENDRLTQMCKDYASQEASWKKMIQDNNARMKDNEEKMSATSEQGNKMQELVKESKEVQGRCQYMIDTFDAERDFLKSQIKCYEQAKRSLVIDRSKSIHLLSNCFNIIYSLTATVSQFQNEVNSCTVHFDSFRKLLDTATGSRKVDLGDVMDENLNLIIASRQARESYEGKSRSSILDSTTEAPQDLLLHLKSFLERTERFVEYAIVPPKQKKRTTDTTNIDADSETKEVVPENLEPPPDFMQSGRYQSLVAGLEQFTDQLLLNVDGSKQKEENLLKCLQDHCSSFTTTDYFELLQENRAAEVQLALLDTLQSTYMTLADLNCQKLSASEKNGDSLNHTLNEKNAVISSLLEDLRVANEIVAQYYPLKEVCTLHEGEINVLKQKVAELEENILSNENIIEGNNAELKRNTDKIAEDAFKILTLTRDLTNMTDQYNRKSKFEDMYNDISYNWHTIIDVMMQVLKLSKKSWTKFFANMSQKGEKGSSGYAGDRSVEKPYLEYKGSEIFELLNQTTLSEPERHCILDLNMLSGKSIEFIDSFDDLSNKLLHQKEIAAEAATDFAKLKLYYAQESIRQNKLQEKSISQTREIRELREKIKDLEDESSEMRSLASKYSSEISSLNKRIKLVQQRNMYAKEDTKESDANRKQNSFALSPNLPTINKDIVVSMINAISNANKTTFSILTNRIKSLSDQLEKVTGMVDSIDLSESLNYMNNAVGMGNSDYDEHDKSDEFGFGSPDEDEAIGLKVGRRAIHISNGSPSKAIHISNGSPSKALSAKKGKSTDLFAPSNLLNASLSLSSAGSEAGEGEEDEGEDGDEGREQVNSNFDAKDKVSQKNSNGKMGKEVDDAFKAENEANEVLQKGMISSYTGETDGKVESGKFLGMIVKRTPDQAEVANTSPDSRTKNENTPATAAGGGGASKVKAVVRKTASPDRDRKDDGGRIGASQISKFDYNDDILKVKAATIETGLHTFTISNSQIAKAPVGKQLSNIVYDEDTSTHLPLRPNTNPGRPQVKYRGTTVQSLMMVSEKEKEPDISIEIKVGKSKFPANLDVQESLEFNDSDEEQSKIDTKYSNSKNRHNRSNKNNDNNDNNSNNSDIPIDVKVPTPIVGSSCCSSSSSNSLTSNSNMAGNLGTDAAPSNAAGISADSNNNSSNGTSESVNNEHGTVADVVIAVVEKSRASTKVVDPKAWRVRKSSFLELRGEKYQADADAQKSGSSSSSENDAGTGTGRLKNSIRDSLRDAKKSGVPLHLVINTVKSSETVIETDAETNDN